MTPPTNNISDIKEIENLKTFGGINLKRWKAKAFNKIDFKRLRVKIHS